MGAGGSRFKSGHPDSIQPLPLSQRRGFCVERQTANKSGLRRPNRRGITRGSTPAPHGPGSPGPSDRLSFRGEHPRHTRFIYRTVAQIADTDAFGEEFIAASMLEVNHDGLAVVTLPRRLQPGGLYAVPSFRERQINSPHSQMCQYDEYLLLDTAPQPVGVVEEVDEGVVYKLST